MYTCECESLSTDLLEDSHWEGLVTLVAVLHPSMRALFLFCTFVCLFVWVFFLQLLHRFRGSSRSPFDSALIISAGKWPLRLLAILHDRTMSEVCSWHQNFGGDIGRPSNPVSFCCRSPGISPGKTREKVCK